MKEYRYKNSNPYTGVDKVGRKFTLGHGDTVTTHDGIIFKWMGHDFPLTQWELRKYFLRVYTVDEQNRYDRIHEHAMIAAMQSLISNLKDVEISMDMHEVNYVPVNAIWFANKLVEELKDKEF